MTADRQGTEPRRRAWRLSAICAAAIVVLATVCLFAAGWEASALTKQLHAVLFDHVAPAVATTGAGNGAWLDHGVTITLTASDGEDGSGVASITYALDGVSHTVAAGTVRVALKALSTATRTLRYRATDEAGNTSDDTALTVHVDTSGPATVAKRADGILGKRLVLRYRLNDDSSPTASEVTIVVKDGSGTVVKRIASGTQSTGAWHSVKWTPSAKGTYTWTVTAKDLAGNRQASATEAKVVVKWPVWRVIGHSVRGRSISIARFGSGKHRLLVIGGVHPMEAGTSAAKQFLTYLTEHPGAVPDGWRIDVIPCLNPDGLAHQTRSNARDVDLNRNFPSSSWQRILNLGDPSRDCGLTGGSRAASEPETKTLMAYLEEGFSAVLTLHSDAGILDCYGPGGTALGQRLSALCGLPVGRLSYQSLMTGTLEQYVAQSEKIPAIIFELTSPELMSGLRRALLAACR